MARPAFDGTGETMSCLWLRLDKYARPKLLAEVFTLGAVFWYAGSVLRYCDIGRGAWSMRDCLGTFLLTGFLSAILPVTSIAEEPGRSVDFDRDIRPILSDKCFTCHGPDEQKRVSGLRLDLQENAFATRDGKAAIVPGDIAASLLHQRITSDDDEQKMPPQDSGRELSDGEIQLLTRWIEQGAKWTEHWSFIPPIKLDLPKVEDASWTKNAIDYFVLARIQQDRLKPSAEADRRTLIRRVTLDLTGLPPTLAEIDAFLADTSDSAFEILVDRLLASPRYGEHMAVGWLDAARYADTSGYQNDGPRSMWRWRDWVIDAFNSNMLFDQFTVEQLAGDLLENASLNQRIATGFNRNHRGNSEGGIIPEEYQVEYVVDRVDTTSTVWLGLTMGCARCHDHKYDPVRQSEFYRVYAYFNNVPESGRALKEGNSPPMIRAPRPFEEQQLRELDERIKTAEARIRELDGELTTSQQMWEATGEADSEMDWSVTNGLTNHLAFDLSLYDQARKVDTYFDVTSSPYANGAIGQSIAFSKGSFVTAGDTAAFGYMDKFTVALWLRAEDPNGTVISRMTPVEEGAGYYLQLRDGLLQVNLINRWLDDAIRLESGTPLPRNEWCHVTMTYDGSRVARGVSVYINGQPFDMNVTLDRINQTFALPLETLRIGSGALPFTGAIDDVRIYNRDVSATEAQLIAQAESISEILQTTPEVRTDGQRKKLTQYFLHSHAADELRNAHSGLEELRHQQRVFEENLPTVMVMEEMKNPRKSYVLTRGQYDQPGVEVQPGVPAVFPPIPENVVNNRLGFARWLASPQHPLTARVAVNRMWQLHFGQGLVRTTEDFGAQGDRPSHPELLDWLAVVFVESGWNVKALHKLIVTSAAYRQSSAVSPDLLKVDPENRLLARGPRKRLTAEAIRDQALFLSGLLNEQAGGPSVNPYQPEGLWKEIATITDYPQSHGKDLYRRSLYSFWKRTVAPPTMVTLDASSREACVVQRSRTNTPLQALALMNDVTFVEAARVFAQRMMTDCGEEPLRQVSQAFRMATAREPRPEELAILKRRYERSLASFEQEPSAAQQLIRSGESPVDTELNPARLAAMTTVTNLILNLDEVVTKE